MLDPMIDFVKDVEPGYSSILAVSEVEAAMRKTKVNKTKQFVHFVVSVVHLKYGRKTATF